MPDLQLTYLPSLRALPLPSSHFHAAEDRRLSWPEWLVTQSVYPRTVTHPNTNSDATVTTRH